MQPNATYSSLILGTLHLNPSSGESTVMCECLKKIPLGHDLHPINDGAASPALGETPQLRWPHDDLCNRGHYCHYVCIVSGPSSQMTLSHDRKHTLNDYKKQEADSSESASCFQILQGGRCNSRSNTEPNCGERSQDSQEPLPAYRPVCLEQTGTALPLREHSYPSQD